MHKIEIRSWDRKQEIVYKQKICIKYKKKGGGDGRSNVLLTGSVGQIQAAITKDSSYKQKKKERNWV